MTSYFDYVRTPGAEIPPPLDTGPGNDFLAGQAVLQDAQVELAQRAVLARYVSRCPVDALAPHGKDRGWLRAPGEDDETYRARLMKSDYLASWAGTAFGITEAFRIVGMPNVEVLEAFTSGWGRNTPAAVGDTHYRWFNVVLRHPHPFGTTMPVWGGFSWGDGTLWGFDGDASRWIALVKQLVRKQKAKGSICEWIAVVLQGDIKHANAADDGDPATPAARVAYLNL